MKKLLNCEKKSLPWEQSRTEDIKITAQAAAKDSVCTPGFLFLSVQVKVWHCKCTEIIISFSSISHRLSFQTPEGS